MLLSDVSIKRPVFASVLGLLLIIFGVVSFMQLPLREYPDIDPPVVSIETRYPGASAAVVETQITEIIEDRISGIEGIEFIESRSRDGRSDITLRFSLGRDIEAAANDVRDRVFRVLGSLPDEADPPEVQKVDADQSVIVWWNLASDRHSVPELTDYAERYLRDRLSVLDGVARVQIGGSQSYAMRIWLDRTALAARNLTVADVERALRAENIELPAGSIESLARQFTVRVERAFRTAEDFERLVLARGEDGYLVRLGDVARVERGMVDDRTLFRGNGQPMVGMGIIRQSTANTLDVARASRRAVEQMNRELPEGMMILPSYDSSVFIEGAIGEVYRTLAIAIVLVVLVIFLFLGSLRAVVIPAVAVPVSLMSTFIALAIFGFTVNLFTLLALVLAIGLVVDDGIIVLENVRRRMDEHGESALVAAFRGTRQVSFAIVSTSLVLVSVFVPIAFLRGDLGRLLAEFALTMAAAVAFSSFVALTLSAMLASKVLRPRDEGNRLTMWLDRGVRGVRETYRWTLDKVLAVRWAAVAFFALLMAGAGWLLAQLPSEYTPPEDRGVFFTTVDGPEGASFAYMADYMNEVEARLMELADAGEVQRLLVRAPRDFGTTAQFNTGQAIVVMTPWGERRPGFTIVNDVRRRLADLPGVRVNAQMNQAFGMGANNPVQFVIGGGSYQELAEWRDILLARIARDDFGLTGLDWDYKETQPQLGVTIDYTRAAELGVTVNDVGRTLETLLGSRRVTTYIDDGQEYDVILEGERDAQRTPASMHNIYVRSARSGALIPLSNLVHLEEFADSTALNRFNRIRSITLSAGLADGVTLGQALDYLRGIAREHLPDRVLIDYKGQSRDFQAAGQAVAFVFLLGLAVVFLVLAAQFESFVHPFVIMLGVPLALGGGAFGLWLTDGSLNVYSQVGLIMLVGLAAKNGILIVEFANQLRDAGHSVRDAILEASVIRMRPIVMTAITTAAGAMPLIVSFGAGSEVRAVIGTVVVSGVIVSAFLTLFAIPVLYSLLAQRTGSPGDVARSLEQQLGAQQTHI